MAHVWYILPASYTYLGDAVYFQSDKVSISNSMLPFVSYTVRLGTIHAREASDFQVSRMIDRLLLSACV